MLPLLVVLGTALALALGLVVGRWARGGAAAARLDAATEAAAQAVRDAEARAEAFEREHVGRARAEHARRQQRLAERVAEAKEAHRTAREGLAARRAQLDQRKQQLEARQARLDARRLDLDAHAARLGTHEAALTRTADALSTLTTEAEHRRTEAETLRAQVQTLAAAVGRRQQEVAAREHETKALESHLETERVRLGALTDEHLRRLEEVGGLSRDEVRARLVDGLAREAKLEAAALVKDTRDEARRLATREAQKIILTAIQRTAASTVIEHMAAVVPLRSDDMKGRVIGREGRNIRSFEAAAGVEVVVDDTPEAVLVSSFDPVRREVARIAMERLLADGRIHPARIEEIVEIVRAEVDEDIVATGEAAALELQIHGLHPELVRLVGRMKYRTSYGQNLLAHSIEVARIASLMAAELGLDARKARRAGLLHDIGKVVEEELESPHAIVGMELCRRYKEHPDIANAVGAHHDEVAMATPIAPLVQAADAASGARPGARREALENYVRRLQDLEALASSFEGVERVYAIQAGREVRVIVDHAAITDVLAETLAADLSRRIEKELEYPGQIKVTVIREVRSVAYAR